MRVLLVAVLVVLLALVSGCGNSSEALKAADVYAKAMEAMQNVNAYGFDMEMTQIMSMPESAEGLERMEIQTQGTGRALQNPMALEMTLTMNMPGLADMPQPFGDIEMQMYMADNQMYMFNSMSGVWMRQDLGEMGLDMDELSGLSQAQTDPMYLLTMFGSDGAAQASMVTEGQNYIISLDDPEGEVMQRIMREYVVEELSDTLAQLQADAGIEELFNNMTFSNLTYKIWVDQRTFYTTRLEMSYSMAITLEGETMVTEQDMVMIFKDFGTFDSITVPDDVKNNAVTLEEFMESMFMNLDFGDFEIPMD